MEPYSAIRQSTRNPLFHIPADHSTQELDNRFLQAVVGGQSLGLFAGKAADALDQRSTVFSHLQEGEQNMAAVLARSGTSSEKAGAAALGVMLGHGPIDPEEFNTVSSRGFEGALHAVSHRVARRERSVFTGDRLPDTPKLAQQRVEVFQSLLPFAEAERPGSSQYLKAAIGAPTAANSLAAVNSIYGDHEPDSQEQLLEFFGQVDDFSTMKETLKNIDLPTPWRQAIELMPYVSAAAAGESERSKVMKQITDEVSSSSADPSVALAAASARFIHAGFDEPVAGVSDLLLRAADTAANPKQAELFRQAEVVYREPDRGYHHQTTADFLLK